jgi:hypothetical protein
MSDLCTLTVDVEGMRRYGENALEHASPPFRAQALMGLLRIDEAVEVAEAAGLHLFARTFRVWSAAPLIWFDPEAAVRTFDELRAFPDPAKRSWGRMWCLIGSVLARLAADDGEGAVADAVALEQVDQGNEVWGGSFWQYGSILHVLALAHVGRYQQARALLREVSTTVLSENYPVMTNDCAVALAYSTSCEGDQSEAARLLAPVVTDARFTMYPMYFFVGRFQSNLIEQLAGDGPLLPSVDAFLKRATTGTGDPESKARIDDELTRFVLSADGR